jgi:hypothetical protein
MWILAHLSVQALHLASVSLQFLQQEHLMHVGASQTIRRGYGHPVQGSRGYQIAEPIETRPFQARPAVALIPEDVLARNPPALHVRAQALKVLIGPPSESLSFLLRQMR